MGALFSLITGSLGGWVLYAMVAAVSAGATWWTTHKIDSAAYLALQLSDANSAQVRAEAGVAAIQNAAKRAMAHQADADAVTNAVALADARAKTKIVTVTQTVTKEVPVYVTAKTDSMFPLPCGFIRLHDAAALGVDLAADPGAIPNPAGKSDDSACEITASQAADVIVQNYGLANGWRQSMIGWQEWYAQQAALWGAQK